MPGQKDVVERFLIRSAEDEIRIDRFLANRLSAWSRTRLKKLIDEGRVRVDRQVPKAHHRMKRGETVSILWPAGEKKKKKKGTQKIPFPILYEDASLVVIDKPAGLVVHPSAGHWDGETLVEQVRPLLSGGAWREEDLRPGLVHRLDRDTSGVILLAKTPGDQKSLSSQFARRQVKKTYLALALGDIPHAEGTLESRLGRHPGKRQRFAVLGTGRWSLTKFKVAERFGAKATLLELYPLTGRTHQLRVQLAAFRHPVLGDHVYGDKRLDQWGFSRQMLHARSIVFRHPRNNEVICCHSPVPEDFQEAIKLIRLNS